MKSGRAQFMRGNFGLMSHWLYGPVDTKPRDGDLSELAAEWNARVDAFDANKLASQIALTKAKWFILTIGQNSGYYCAPNPVYDEIAGYPVSKCSRRDLFRDLALALKAYGIRTLAYLPSGAPDADRQACERFEWTDSSLRDENGVMLRSENGYRLYERGAKHRLQSFQRKWERVIRCWAEGWGELCAGWWIDGVYFADAMYNFEDAPNFASFAAALRSGNPQAAICFNPGIYRMDSPAVQSAEEDYCPGELNSYLYAPFGRKKISDELLDGRIGGAQFHLLNYLGGNWGQGPAPRFPDELTNAWTKYILSNNGGVTWDVPTNPKGDIPEAFMPALKVLGEAVYG